MKKTKKWILGLLLAGCLMLSLPACGETEKKRRKNRIRLLWR